MFHVVPSSITDRNYNPGPEAVSFYTDFANPLKEVYTWNQDFPSSLDAFAQDKVAIAFGYSRDIPQILAKRQGKLNFGVASVPQIPGRPEVNVANYWVTGVSRKSKQVNAAWDFLQFATKKEQAQKYLTATKQPTALRSLVATQLQDDELSTFAKQLLTAQSWYHGSAPEIVASAFGAMVTEVLTDQTDIRKVVGNAAAKISQTL